MEIALSTQVPAKLFSPLFSKGSERTVPPSKFNVGDKYESICIAISEFKKPMAGKSAPRGANPDAPATSNNEPFGKNLTAIRPDDIFDHVRHSRQ